MGSAFAAAMVIGATNPKTFIVLGAILPGFIPPGQPWWAPALLAPIPIAIGLVTDMLWAVAAARAAAWLPRSTTGPRALAIIGGVLLVTLGIVTAVTS
ncbi:hypothetical protein J7E22_00820 [Curtobacterium sp. ISL-83]|nr:hypothetical protein [Curtobacterium sp. ISL-83]